MKIDPGLVEDFSHPERNQRPILVVGAGVSLQTTQRCKPDHKKAQSWLGLVRHAIQTAVHDKMPASQAAELTKRLQSSDDRELLHVATVVKDHLDRKGQFEQWIEDAFADWSEEDFDWRLITAIQALDSRIATTNYDLLLSKRTHQHFVEWTEHRLVDKALFQDDKYIVHFHGHYLHPHSMIFSEGDYDRLGRNEFAQHLQRAATHATLVFVGCGAGLGDPNISLLMEWIDRFGGTNRHYRLGTEEDIQGWPELRSVRDVPYSKNNHGELAAYLEELHRQSSKARERRSSRPPVSPPGSPQQVGPVIEHEGKIFRIALSPDGTRLAAVGKANDIGLWDTTDSGEAVALPAEVRWQGYETYAVAFSHDGSMLATGGRDGFHVRTANDGKLFHDVDGHVVHALAFGGSLLVASDPQGAQIWSLDGIPSLTGKIDTEQRGSWYGWDPVTSAALSPTGRFAATVRGRFSLWVMPEAPHLLTEAEPPAPMILWENFDTEAVVWCLKGQRLITVASYGFVRIYDTKDLLRAPSTAIEKALKRAARDLSSPPGYVKDWGWLADSDKPQIAVSDDGHLLATITKPGVSVWDISREGSPEAPLITCPLDSPPDAIALTADGSMLATASGTGIRLWRLPTG